MIHDFIKYLNNSYNYRFTNGYMNIEESQKQGSDFDILFEKNIFSKIDELVEIFCEQYNYKIVQCYNQGLFSKNFFIYDSYSGELLNLDLYGELCRNDIKILNEEDVFKESFRHKNISILNPSQEFIQYLIKKIDKQKINETTFNYLVSLFKIQPIKCKDFIFAFFKTQNEIIVKAFIKSDFTLLIQNLANCKNDFINSNKKSKINGFSNLNRILRRVTNPTGITICFLGPDGSGKTTIINGVLEQILPFRRNDYFHLKPVPQNISNKNNVVANPQEAPLYSKPKSFMKLIYYILLYNIGWFKNILPKKVKSSLVIFDRYYDDILVDNKRFRYNSVFGLEKIVKYLIPRPKIYFVLTADAEIIYKRKQEVSFEELERQIDVYRSLTDNKRYFNINVDKTPEIIVKEITNILMGKLNERY